MKSNGFLDPKTGSRPSATSLRSAVYCRYSLMLATEMPLTPMISANLFNLLHRVHPLEAELRFFLDGGDVVDRGKSLFPLRRIRDVGVEQSQVELNVQGLFVQLPGKVHPRFGRIDVLVQIQNQI